MPGKFDDLHGYVSGRGKIDLVLGHGFGCDQTVWTRLLPWLEAQFRVIRFDFAGCGPDGEANYDKRRHNALFGHADDLLDILDELRLERIVYIGHSVGSMIGAAAAVTRPEAFSRLVMLAGSPCYLNQPGYTGGFDQSDLDALYKAMSINFQAWAAGFVPAVVGVPDHAAVEEFSFMLFQMRPDIALAMARTIFQSDMRGLLRRLRCPVHILQTRKDIAVPLSIARWMQSQIPEATLDLIESEGHLPHLTDPDAVLRVLERQLAPPLLTE